MDNPEKHIPIIGIVGGIGSGKSTLSELLEERGCAIICADKIAHQHMHSTRVIETLTEWWGPSIMLEENRLDRQKIREIINKHPEELKRLEELIHPQVRQTIDSRTDRIREEGKHSAIVWDIPLLYEREYDIDCDAVIFIDADYDIRLDRVMSSRDWTEEDLKKMEERQYDLKSKRRAADHILTNNGTKEQLAAKLDAINWKTRKSFTQRLSELPPPNWDQNDIVVHEVLPFGKNKRNDGGFVVRWSKPNCGFGELTFRMVGGKFTCDTECMSRQFVRHVLEKMGDMVDITG